MNFAINFRHKSPSSKLSLLFLSLSRKNPIDSRDLHLQDNIWIWSLKISFHTMWRHSQGSVKRIQGKLFLFLTGSGWRTTADTPPHEGKKALIIKMNVSHTNTHTHSHTVTHTHNTHRKEQKSYWRFVQKERERKRERKKSRNKVKERWRKKMRKKIKRVK